MSLARGDERRTALLSALEEHLRTSSLDDINVADISRSAGLSRSAFYFYFDNKAAAVGALYQEMIAQGSDAAELLSGEGDLRDRIARAIRAVFDGWSDRVHLLRAVLDARAASPAVRDQWEAFQQAMVDVLGDVIAAERASGHAPDPPGAVAPRELAAALLDLTDRTLERVVRPPTDFDRERHLDAVVHVWLAAIYGSLA